MQALSKIQVAYQRVAAGGNGITGISEVTQGPGDTGVLTQWKGDTLVNILGFPQRLEKVTEPKDGSNCPDLGTEEKLNPNKTKQKTRKKHPRSMG